MIQIIITAVISFNIGFIGALFWYGCHQKQNKNFINKKGDIIMKEKLSLDIIGLQYLIETLYSNTEFTATDILKLVPNDGKHYVKLCLNKLIDERVVVKTENGYRCCEVKDV